MAAKYWVLIIIILFVLIASFFVERALVTYFSDKGKIIFDGKKITNFEECVAAGYPVGESYPRQCWAEGKQFVEEINIWENDGIILMQNSETGEYGCFCCGRTLCIDPIPIMEQVKETPYRYCSEDFEVIDSNQNFCPPESRNVDACITLYDPVCGWNDPDEIQCIKFPCASTYSNSCNACKNSDVLYWTSGVCPE